MKWLRLPLVLVLSMVVACQDQPVPTSPPAGTQRDLYDGSTGGNPHFYFLPPLADEPEYAGDLDGEVDVEVVVCEWMGATCGPTVAEFDGTGAGSERVRVDGQAGHYIVNWHPVRGELTAGAIHRITVLGDGVELGHVDVMAVMGGPGTGKGNGRGRGPGVDPGDYFPLTIGRTLPIKFRIEVGAFDSYTATVVGSVTELGGGGLGGVSATLEGTAIMASTDATGRLKLEGVRTGRTAVIRLTKSGYADRLVQLDIPTGVEDVTFRASLTPRAAPVTVSADAPSTATSTDGASVSLPAGGLVDGSGAPVTGDVEVSITPVDVSGDGIEAFPGSFTGVNTAGEDGLLLTYGVAEYVFEQDGEELNLAPGETATIRIPIYSGDSGLTEGDQIPLWYLDETTGDWQEEGLGTVVSDAESPTGLALEGQVNHFSWWNIDVWVNNPYEPLVRCQLDGAFTACSVKAQNADPNFPRLGTQQSIPAGGTRLSFPPVPQYDSTDVTASYADRYGTLMVGGPSGGGAGDTVIIDLTETGVVSVDSGTVVLSTDTVSMPDSLTITFLAVDSTGAPNTAGGGFVYFVIRRAVGRPAVSLAVDNGDGTYTSVWVPGDDYNSGGETTEDWLGDYTVEAWHSPGGPLPVPAPPVHVRVADGAARGTTSVISVSPATVAEGGTATVTVQARDEFGTALTTGGDIVCLGVLTGAVTGDGTLGPVTDNGDGTYTATFTATAGGAPVSIEGSVNAERVATLFPTVAVTDPVISAAEVEPLLAEAFPTWFAAHLQDLGFPLTTMADEASSSWLTAAMLALSKEPRQAWNNDHTYTYAYVTETPWLGMYMTASAAYDAIRAIEGGAEVGGAGGPDNPRALAYAKLMQGLAHGWLALQFDQAFILDESVSLSSTLPLRPYTEVMDSAVAYLEQAIAVANANTFTLPNTWINGLGLSNVGLAQVAHSYAARFLAQKARTPADRAAADWSAIISHIDQGITTDFAPVGDGFRIYHWTKTYGGYGEWMRGDYRTIGGVAPNDPETDPNGDYAAWLATPVSSRTPFDLTTLDQRIWDGTYDLYGNPNPGTYWHWDPMIVFEASRGTYHFSNYVSNRWNALILGGQAGTGIPILSTTEMDLLKAEGLWRTGQPGAATLINQTRVNNGGLSAATDADPDLFDKLAYEKRIETYQLSDGLAYFDRRGWGTPVAPQSFGHGLVDGTPHHFPVPGSELERLGLANYTFGGTGALFDMAGAREAPSTRAGLVYGFDAGMPVSEKIERMRRMFMDRGPGSPR